MNDFKCMWAVTTKNATGTNFRSASAAVIHGGAGNDFIESAETLNIAQRQKPTDSWTVPTGAQVLAMGANWGAYLQDKVYFWNRPMPIVIDDARDVVDAGAGDDYVFGSGGNTAAMNATYLVAAYARHSVAAGLFECKNRVIAARKPCLRWRFDRSNIKNIHSRSMWLAGHKWLGRRLDAAWGSSQRTW